MKGSGLWFFAAHFETRVVNEETHNLDDWPALRERMRAVRRAGVGQDTPYLRILRRFVPE